METMPEKGMKTAEEAPKLHLIDSSGYDLVRARHEV